MEIPDGYKGEFKSGDVLKLLKGLYGLKQSGKLWYEDLKKTLLELKFIQSDFDASLYFKFRGNDLIYVTVYVDDILVAASNENDIQELHCGLKSKYKLTAKGPIKEILNMIIQLERVYRSVKKNMSWIKYKNSNYRTRNA
jgi:hypothetical protein